MKKNYFSGVLTLLLTFVATAVNAAVSITASGGWFESAYVEFNTDGASYYNVYYSTNKSSWTKIDDQLVRKYGSKGRADVMGITAGTYYIKVASVTSSGSESSYTVSNALTVKAHDRGGFAHKNWSKGIGAYTNNGTLKSGANILYITKSNAKTIKMSVPSSASAKTEYTGLQTIIDAWTKAYGKGWSTTPLCIRVLGTLSYADMDKFSSSSEGIQIKGTSAYSDCPITFEGVGNDAVIHGFGFLIRNLTDFEMRNFAIMDALDDCVSLDTSNSHCWIHNLDLFYGQAGSDADQKKGDGTIDLKGNSQWITISYNHFWDSGKSSLCGMKSETGPNYITYHHNWFDHSDSRHPRIRTMSVHLYNNYFDGNSKYGVGTTMGSSAFVDRNYFRNCKNPMMRSLNGTDAAGEGTFSGESTGYIKSFGNVITGAKSFIASTNSATSGITESSAITKRATSYDAVVVASTSTKLSDGYDNFDTNSSVMYSYTADAAADVPSIVKGTYGAGRLQHGSYQYTFSSSDDDGYAVISALKSAVEGYKSTSYYTGVTASMYFKSNVIPTSSTTQSNTTVEAPVTDSSSSSSSGSTSGSTSDSSSSTGSNSSSDSSSSTGSTTGSSSSSTTSDICSFTGSKPSMSSVSVTGNYSTSKGTVTYNGKTYTTAVKMESATKIVFTLAAETDVTFVFGGSTSAAGQTFKLNGTSYTLGSNGTLTKTLKAGSYTITKGSSINIFAIAFAAQIVADPTTWNFSDVSSKIILAGSNYEYSYKGLTIVGNTSSSYTSDYLTSSGFHCNGGSSATMRYIKYTATSNGTLTVKFASNNTSDLNRTSAIGTAVGTPIVKATCSAGTMTANVTAGKTYYIYFVSGGQTIKSITMTPGATTASLNIDLEEAEETAIEAVTDEVSSTKKDAGKKVFYQGKMVIIKDGQMYNFAGQLVK